jgi:hypothetical protein
MHHSKCIPQNYEALHGTTKPGWPYRAAARVRRGARARLDAPQTTRGGGVAGGGTRAHALLRPLIARRMQPRVHGHDGGTCGRTGALQARILFHDGGAGTRWCDKSFTVRPAPAHRSPPVPSPRSPPLVGRGGLVPGGSPRLAHSAHLPLCSWSCSQMRSSGCTASIRGPTRPSWRTCGSGCSAARSVRRGAPKGVFSFRENHWKGRRARVNGKRIAQRAGAGRCNARDRRARPHKSTHDTGTRRYAPAHRGTRRAPPTAAHGPPARGAGSRGACAASARADAPNTRLRGIGIGIGPAAGGHAAHSATRCAAHGPAAATLRRCWTRRTAPTARR